MIWNTPKVNEMSVQYKDYYDALKVERGASQDEIQKAYKKLARKYHPDLNQDDPKAEERFKDVGEAYEVLKDPESRAAYDRLGANWKNGQRFEPPPGWGGGGGAGPGGFHFNGDVGGMSDFFQSIFGMGGGGGQRGGGNPFGGGSWPTNGQDLDATLVVTLNELLEETVKELNFETEGEQGLFRRKKSQPVKVRIPKGATEGSVIRLSGKGQKGSGGGRDGDLRLTLKLAEHPLFEVNGHNLTSTVKLSAWEAALGTSIDVTTLDGVVKLKVPPGVQSGQKMRLTGKGLPTKKGFGDLHVVLKICVPKTLSERERELFESLAKESTYDPRAESV